MNLTFIKKSFTMVNVLIKQTKKLVNDVGKIKERMWLKDTFGITS